MKKYVVLLAIGMISSLLLLACSPKDQKRTTEPPYNSTTERDSTSLKPVSSLDSNATSASSLAKPTSLSDSSDETAIPLSNQRNLPENLLPYSDSQIEYARVWLAVQGSDFVAYLDEPEFNFNLNVEVLPAGSLINIYAEGTATYPVDVIQLSGNASFQGSVIYASNHNGTVTVYPTPMHWHYSEEQAKDATFLKEASQWILDNTEVVEVPAGTPESVKRLIDLENINF